MKIDRETIKELAALHAAGALGGVEAEKFAALLAESAEARAELASFGGVVEALAASDAPVPQPPEGLKARILKQAAESKIRRQLEAQLAGLLPPSKAGFAYMKEATTSGWIPLPVPGAYVKLLSFDGSTGFATVLGKLDPGARYPGHRHQRAEDIFMISGDLHIGGEALGPMDFHHAEAGTDHGVNWSENGCVLLAVLSKEDLVGQFMAA